MLFVLSIDDFGGVIPLPAQQRTVAFCAEQGLPATLFLTPHTADGWRAEEDAAFTRFVAETRAAGHDFQLHGLTHGAYEFGPSPPWMRALGGAAEEERFQRLRPELEPGWTVPHFTEMLTAAVGTFTAVVGQGPLVFRSGALSQCEALYEALPAVGLRYASNRVTDVRGWRYMIGEYDTDWDWDPAEPPAPYRLTDRVTMLPLISEYAWYVPEEHVPQHVALAAEDLRRVAERDGVFLLVCHCQCVGGEEAYARRIVGEIPALARAEYDAEFLTLAELVGRLDAGAVPVLDRPSP